MPSRIASDHDAVDTHRARLAAVGRTDRIQIELPESVVDGLRDDEDSGDEEEDDDQASDDVVGGDVASDDVVGADVVGGDVVSRDACWFALDGDGGFATVTETLEGTPVVRRVVDNRRQARDGDGVDRLQAWADDTGLSAGDSVHLDVLDRGFAYGLRTPGRSVVYEPPEEPDASLADIARDLGTE